LGECHIIVCFKESIVEAGSLFQQVFLSNLLFTGLKCIGTRKSGLVRAFSERNMMLDSKNLMADENVQCERMKKESKSAFVLRNSR